MTKLSEVLWIGLSYLVQQGNGQALQGAPRPAIPHAAPAVVRCSPAMTVAPQSLADVDVLIDLPSQPSTIDSPANLDAHAHTGRFTVVPWLLPCPRILLLARRRRPIQVCNSVHYTRLLVPQWLPCPNQATSRGEALCAGAVSKKKNNKKKENASKNKDPAPSSIGDAHADNEEHGNDDDSEAVSPLSTESQAKKVRRHRPAPLISSPCFKGHA